MQSSFLFENAERWWLIEVLLEFWTYRLRPMRQTTDCWRREIKSTSFEESADVNLLIRTECYADTVPAGHTPPPQRQTPDAGREANGRQGVADEVGHTLL